MWTVIVCAFLVGVAFVAGKYWGAAVEDLYSGLYKHCNEGDYINGDVEEVGPIGEKPAILKKKTIVKKIMVPKPRVTKKKAVDIVGTKLK